MPWVETEFEEEFKQWIIDFSTNQTPEIYRLLEGTYRNKKIYIFRTREEAADFLKQIT